MPKEMRVYTIRISCRNSRGRSSTEKSSVIIMMTVLKENPASFLVLSEQKGYSFCANERGANIITPHSNEREVNKEIGHIMSKNARACLTLSEAVFSIEITASMI